MTLVDLFRGELARVIGIDLSNPDIAIKLREVGFAEGDEVEMLHRGPFGGPPLAVRLNRTMVALRLSEAAAICVERQA